MSKVGDPSRDPPIVLAPSVTNKPNSHLEEEVTLQTILDDYVEHSSLHGVWRAAKTSVFSRTLWTLALLGMTCLCLFTFITQLMLFLEFKTNTVVTIEERPFLPFPAVTICNYNTFRKSKALQNPDVTKTLEQLFSLDRLFNTHSMFMSTAQIADNLDILKEMVDLAHTLDGLVKHCRWCGAKIDCRRHFVQTMTDSGVCYTFNAKNTSSDVTMLVRDAGSDCSLRLVLSIEKDEYFYGLGDSTGVKLLVHDPFEDPLVRQHGLSAAPGTTINAAIKLQQELHAAHPYGNCVDVTDVSFKNPLHYHDQYTYTGCKSEHRVDYIYNACQCVQYYHSIGGRKICANYEQIECAREAEENHTMYKLQELSTKCPVTCEYNTFEVKLSWASFPAQHILDDIQETFNMSADDVRDNLLQLLIYYEDLAVHRQEQTPAYTLGSLFADTGGEMGLCIGASLLTIVELVALCGNITSFTWKKITKKLKHGKHGKYGKHGSTSPQNGQVI